jgi:hypothetical protein
MIKIGDWAVGPQLRPHPAISVNTDDEPDVLASLFSGPRARSFGYRSRPIRSGTAFKTC